MARKIAEIQAQIQGQVVTNYADAGITIDPTKWSKRNIMRLWTWIVAAAIAILEQLMDLFKSDIEATLLKAPPATPLWIQSKSFEFQYSATNPQVVQLVDLVPVYPTIDETLQIITRCSVKTDLSNNVKIKAAKSDPPAALAAGELSAFQEYIDIIGIAGVNYVCSSTASDKLYVAATIYFQGQYSAVISDYVITAITDYLAGLPFNGELLISDLELVIRNTAGVNDVVLNNVKARANSVILASATSLVLSTAIISRNWPTIAGYIVEEDTAGNTFADTLTFVAQ